MSESIINVYEYRRTALPQGYQLCVELCGRAFKNNRRLRSKCPKCKAGEPPLDPFDVEWFRGLHVLENDDHEELKQNRTGIYEQNVSEDSGTFIVAITKFSKKYRINYTVGVYGRFGAEDIAFKARNQIYKSQKEEEADEIMEQLLKDQKYVKSLHSFCRKHKVVYDSDYHDYDELVLLLEDAKRRISECENYQQRNEVVRQLKEEMENL